LAALAANELRAPILATSSMSGSSPITRTSLRYGAICAPQKGSLDSRDKTSIRKLGIEDLARLAPSVSTIEGHWPEP
jgi:hypothetical protein